MNANEILSVKDGEKPLDNLVTGGGFASIFRTIAVVGDSLSSGEFESQKDGVKGYTTTTSSTRGVSIWRATSARSFITSLAAV